MCNPSKVYVLCSIFTSSLLGIKTTIFKVRLFKSLSQRRDHSPKPVEVQSAQRRIADHICYRKPRRYRQATRRLKSSPDILIHPDALIRAPDQATGAESRDERGPIHELCGRPRHAELIHEPVDIEEWRRQLVQDEVQTVVIAEWALGSTRQPTLLRFLFTPL